MESTLLATDIELKDLERLKSKLQKSHELLSEDELRVKQDNGSLKNKIDEELKKLTKIEENLKSQISMHESDQQRRREEIDRVKLEIE